jgi:signal transduction histidine kinase
MEAAPLEVPIAAADLRDVVDILVDNVFAHTEEGVAFAVLVIREGAIMRLEVADEGGGLDPSARPGGRPGSTGLGLDLARRTVAARGGTLRVNSTPGAGTRVVVELPSHES